jgi:hypothetical protein
MAQTFLPCGGAAPLFPIPTPTPLLARRWVLEWPGQVVICVDCMYWTREMAEAVTRGELNEYAQQCTEELLKVGVGRLGARGWRLESGGLGRWRGTRDELPFAVGGLG